MIRKRFTVFALTVCVSLGLFGGCSFGNGPDLLFCYAGNSSDEFGGSVYAQAISSLGKKCDATVLELGSDQNSFKNGLSEALSKREYEAVVVVGETAYQGLASYIKSYKGMNFVALDCRLSDFPSNVAAVEFAPEEFGYLGGGIAAAGLADGEGVGYLSSVRNSFDNRVLYGFLQGVNGGEKGCEVVAKYVEEKTNVVKATDYVREMYDLGASRVFDTSGRSALGSLESAKAAGKELVYGGVDLLEAAAQSKGADVLTAVCGGVKKNYAAAASEICKMVKSGLETGKSYELGVRDGAFDVVGAAAETVGLKTLSGNESEFETLREALVVDEDAAYTPQHSVDAAYHEAVPSCADTNDWKYKPRAGENNGMKPLGWKGVGVWATIYLQDGRSPVSNTGIEFRNMRIWAYTKTLGWKLLEHANPTGAFYDENFSGDSHTSFVSNYINYASEKRTRIKLDYSTIGYNYHPFGSQIDLEEEGFLDANGDVLGGDTLYIFSEMEIRLCVWDSAVASDIDDAKYVANVGADWWREVGLGWTPDWNSNKDVCVGQFRTIAKNWKKLYMTNVPSDKYGEIFESFPFDE